MSYNNESATLADSRDTHKKIKIMNLLCGKSIVGAGGGSIMV